MNGEDQAAGLRRWVQARGQQDASSVAEPVSSEKITLMVVGLPDESAAQVARVTAVLEAWAAAGKRWVGNPDHWRVVALDVNSEHLELLASQQSRWALWIDIDKDGFRKAYRVLQQLGLRSGPKRLLAMHPPVQSSRGLLSNVQQAAEELFGIELLVLQP
ncbi:hypothetical protein TOI97_08780 [Denitrificimonas sp. JX-1]|uniref:Uncharacterized protein n=1 Tax=Denitrificimonas halotolerans TaxID=3098930 RepID=A0ABU5GSI4_9GAMM|nr:hypothetical protein [Denitrificimonas sp. JX-1]MDY7219655.1 hypothetical protein [Denitrificimonas sp. JX-1]